MLAALNDEVVDFGVEGLQFFVAERLFEFGGEEVAEALVTDEGEEVLVGVLEVAEGGEEGGDGCVGVGEEGAEVEGHCLDVADLLSVVLSDDAFDPVEGLENVLLDPGIADGVAVVTVRHASA